MPTDNGLARIVVAGLILITIAVLAAGTYLKATGKDDGNMSTLVAAGLGALAGYLGRGTNGTSTPVA